MLVKYVLVIVIYVESNNIGLFEHTIGVIGTGYVGLVTGAGLADIGNTVICADIEKNKIDALNHGIIPIYEAGLDECVARNVRNERLSFTSDVEAAIRQSSILFIAVGTPMAENGQADLSAVTAVMAMISRNIDSYKVIVIKSTVPIGTCRAMSELLRNRGIDVTYFDIVSNPEFLRQGVALSDFLSPERIVLGIESDKAQVIIQEVYKPLIDRGIPTVFTNLETSETIKYASNAFLATKISFINEMANLCAATGRMSIPLRVQWGLINVLGLYF